MLRVLILVAVVVGLALWLLRGRRVDTTTARRPGRGENPAQMIACAHCGVHLPRPDAVFDAEGRSYCGEPHRVAGPR
ncbi:MAG: hypothetical protein KIT17_02505 [Rubrivivax sp.]|nr:hypothetical protein [Rubrivivax sp.]